MNELVKKSVDARKEAVYNAYEITDEETKAKVDDFFKRLEEFASNYKDALEFEAAFGSDEMNQEYTDLFTDLAMHCESKTYDSGTSDVKSDKDIIKDEIAGELKYQADDLTQPIRREANQKVYDAARDIPVVNEVLTAKQHKSFFDRFKKKKD